MTLTLEVSPETALRVERAKSQGMNMDTLLCYALEQWNTQETTDIASLAGKYEGEAWDELLAEMEKNRQNVESIANANRTLPVRQGHHKQLFG